MVSRTSRAALLTATGLLATGLTALQGALPAAAATWDATLTRYPYLTDTTTSSMQVTWADTYANTYGTVTWGPAGGSCATSSAKATKLGTRFTVGTTAEYQHSITISGLSADTSYCYRIKGGSTSSVDLLGADASPVFSTLPTSGSYTFLTFGDWGDTAAGYNVNQAKLHALMASSGASFAVGTGDIAYNTGTQNQYGDLVNTGTSVSEVFGPDYWRRPGAVLPFFTTPGNHGRTSTFFQNWPEPKATSQAGESYQVVSYPASTTLGYAASQGPGAWYAFDVAGTRNYVLTADWSDTNTGSADGALCSKQFSTHTCPDYQTEADVHWKPGRAEYDWLKADLQAHATQQKLAFFHYPLRSDVSTEPDDPYLQNSPLNPNRSTSLEKLLYDSGVRLAFNGHAHAYQRNIAPPGGLTSYLTGGGGAKLTAIAGGSVVNCSTTDAYGLGWSSGGGSYCGAAGAKPSSDSKVFHFLKVTVSGSTVTVTPTNADGESFDAQTYKLGADSTAPTAPGSVSASYVSGTKPYASVTWTSGSDNNQLAAYDVYRADPGGSRSYLGTVAPNVTSFKDSTAAANTAYVYSVDSRDLQDNTATRTAPPLAGGGDTSAPSAPTNLSGTATSSTSVDLTWTASTDNVGVTGYDVYRNGSLVKAGASGTTYTDTGLTASTTYAYTVKAKDAAGNVSPASNTASVTTPAGGGGGGTTSSFTASEDARVDQKNPTSNYGTSSTLGADLDPAAQQESYLKFAVTGTSGTVTSAKLRLWTTTGSTSATNNGPAVYRVAANSWTENGITWNNKPAVTGAELDNAGALGTDSMVEYDVTSAITGNGTYSLKLMPDSADGTSFNSRTGSVTTKRPELLITTSGGGSGGGDTTAPSAPTNLSGTATSSTSVDLTWTASTDNVGVTGYDVYRNGSLVKAGASGTTYTDTGLTASTTYAYTVKAKDAAGNVSPASNTASVTTPAGGGGGGTTSSFTASEDARVDQKNPTSNYGTSSTLGADLDPAAQQESYLKFAVTGTSGTVTSAKLRLWTTTGSTSATNNGPAVYRVAANSWTENGITWNNKPAVTGAELDNAGALGTDSMVEYDVTSAITGNGTYSLKLMPDSADGTSFNSRTGSVTTKRPELLITTS